MMTADQKRKHAAAQARYRASQAGKAKEGAYAAFVRQQGRRYAEAERIQAEEARREAVAQATLKRYGRKVARRSYPLPKRPDKFEPARWKQLSASTKSTEVWIARMEKFSSFKKLTRHEKEDRYGKYELHSSRYQRQRRLESLQAKGVYDSELLTILGDIRIGSRKMRAFTHRAFALPFEQHKAELAAKGETWTGDEKQLRVWNDKLYRIINANPFFMVAGLFKDDPAKTPDKRDLLLMLAYPEKWQDKINQLLAGMKEDTALKMRADWLDYKHSALAIKS